MYGLFMTIYPIRIQQKTLCSILDISRETLRSLQRNDPLFPKGIKQGTSKQAPVYFDYMQIIEWHKAQMKNLETVENEVNE